MLTHEPEALAPRNLSIARRTAVATLFLMLPAAASVVGQEHAAYLLSGPMVGHTTSAEATVWVETDRPASIAVNYWVEAGTQPIVRGAAAGRTAAAPPHTGAIRMEGLPERGIVHYELEIDGRVVRPETAQVFRLLPAAGSEAANFSIAFASCINPSRVPLQPIWTQVAIFRPDALLLIGDNNYMPMRPAAYETDESTVAYTMARYHRYLRDLPGLRSVLATTPTYAIWDDHDFGPNNADRTFRWRDLTLNMFTRYWPNPDAGTTDTPGVFYSFRIGDAEFFMLDDRYHRDPNDAPERATMLGAGQLEWLKDGLGTSPATFKVIVNGHTLTIDREGSGEYWANFGSERDEFLEWMYAEGIEGVLFASGDWHVGSLSRVAFSESGYPLFELISSNAGVSSVEDDANHYRHHRQIAGHNRNFDGPIVNDIHDYNFGLLEFSGEPGSRSVTLKIVDHHGAVRVSHRLTEKDLSSRWRD